MQFNFTGIHLPNNPLIPRTIPGSDIIQSLESAAQSAVATAVSPAISNVESAANTAATAIPDISKIGHLIPLNCSLGTKQFCVGFDDRVDCNNLPLNLSSLVPKTIASFVRDQVQVLQPLEDELKKVTPTNIQHCLTGGLVLVLVMAVIFISSIFRRLFCFAKFLLRLSIFIRVLISLTVGLVCCIPFLIPTVILFDIQSKTENMPSSIKIEKGEVGNYCLGALGCFVSMILLVTVSLVFI